MLTHPGVSPRTAYSKTLTRPPVGKTPAKEGVGVLTIDSRGVIVSCSPAAAAMFSCSRYELESGTIWSLFSDIAPGAQFAADRDDRVGHLRDDGSWQRFTAVNVYGHGFPVDLAMLKSPPTGDRKLFELRLRRASGE